MESSVGCSRRRTTIWSATTSCARDDKTGEEGGRGMTDDLIVILREQLRYDLLDIGNVEDTSDGLA
jgi:hypothetical protein